MDAGPCPLAEALRPLRPFQPVALFLALGAFTPNELIEAQGFCVDGVGSLRCLTGGVSLGVDVIVGGSDFMQTQE